MIKKGGYQMKFYNKEGDIFNFNFKINREKNGSLSGFLLKPDKQEKARFFCLTFLKALNNKEGKIMISNHGLWLVNGFYTDVYLPLKEEELKEFYQFYKSGKVFYVTLNIKLELNIIHEN